MDLTDEQIETAIQNSVDNFRMMAQAQGESEEDIEERATILRESLEESYSETLPSAECSREFERLAEDVNAVVVSEWE
ncbi:hypothetical protein [Haloarcula argentinensis]|uniref:Uncharacterized protein n=1 Tax=Haloarcula argentinensis TaxID=43776 RepID=A0A830FWW8_HALAR|nr:hypothetical protein [Haloarcula argentinensis]EMA26734.1 hypothetical protein C443_00157 [Haloarcula argentinensis DSM 12282]MDS0255826.1 hypothetical protein [Haloarcula argentinensis]GGM50143.1 hypothetical protein GCM10009006_34170 [Haloarcula argentinensis]